MKNERAVIYARFSSHNQKELSIEGQIRECTQYAESQGMVVVGQYIDRALSGKTDARPDFQRMIKDSAHGRFDVVICYKLNRFARNRYDSATYKAKLKKNGVRVIYSNERIPDGPEGIILESVLEGFAEYYSVELAQNVNRGLHDTAMKCQSTGGRITFGYKIENKMYVIDETTAPIVRLIFDMWNKGDRMRDILEAVNGIGIRTTLGRTFVNTSISSIIRNKRYTGVYIYRDIEIAGGIPALITNEVFDKAQIRLDAGRAKMRSGKPKIAFELTTVLNCGICGAPMIGESGISGKNGNKYTYYTCVNRKRKHTCSKANVRRDWIEKIVIDLTCRHILQPAVINKIVDAIILIQEEEHTNDVLTALESQLRETDTSLAHLLKAIEKGLYSPTVEARIGDLESIKVALQESIDREKIAKPVFSRDYFLYWFDQFKCGNVDDSEYRRRVLDSFVNTVFLTDEYIHIIYNYKDGQEKVMLEDLPPELRLIENKKAPSESSDSTYFGGA